MKQQTKKILLIVFGTLLIVSFGLYKLAVALAPGSYPFAEEYELKYPEEIVIKAINKFKTDNPDYIVPQVNIAESGPIKLNYPSELIDERRDSLDHWYHVYFYYKKENIILYALTRPITKKKTSFLFVSINNGLTIGNWLEINDDLGFFENRKVKKEFEIRILKEIEVILNNNSF